MAKANYTYITLHGAFEGWRLYLLHAVFWFLRLTGYEAQVWTTKALPDE